MGAEPPALSKAAPIEMLLDEARRQGRGPVERCLVYCPDAVGTAAVKENPSLFDPLRRAAHGSVEVLSVFPPKTPVCFASMFTGAPPEAHGIRRYVQRVLECDTVFDSLIRAGRRVSIVTVRGSSMEVLFKGRGIDIYAESDDERVTGRAAGLIGENRHDLIVAYHQEYDDILHKTDPKSAAAKAAIQRHVAAFGQLAEACRLGWGNSARLTLFAPDHGAHVDNDTGTGDHGQDIPEDMEVTFFAGFSTGDHRKQI
jgi:hypothetical protein